ncbi:Crp/Fnr family transcriptional regulator [Chryseobacterium sp. PS-8]|uniref:Crp/Fnr family transcriptional regulator n=1 Tax=Chryseobacterium indicum TaxID=2766954 RepID=A0ABS9CA99_9FLAO|nr:Crp/Fnr family transcriptional regulator [Chryseobacterium sp. PS-8]MCF2221493.1 Crp/Fnr family transcriptional regulator [Chryseobacterium sp. PS-8]
MYTKYDIDIDNSVLLAKLKAFINHFVQVTDEEFLFFASILKRIKIPRDSYFLKAGEICTYVGFVNKGAVKYVYNHNKNHKELVIDFLFEGEWTGDYASYIYQKPSRFSVQAIEKTELFILPLENNVKLHEKYPVFIKYNKLLVEAMLYETLNRIVQFQGSSTEEIYRHLITRRPFLFERVSMHDIANYLKITPQSLSRIRSKIR